MTNIQSKIIDYIKKNRVSTTEVADALDKKGSIDRVKLINPSNINLHIVGQIYCVFASSDSNFLVHKEIIKVKKNDVVIIFTDNCNEKSIIGDLIAKYLILYKQAQAIIVLGNVRDASKLIRENYPIWSYGFNPIGCVNFYTKPFPKEKKENILLKYNKSIAVCDAGGVVVIEKNKINNKFLNSIKSIEAQEDLWYYCLDSLKWNTLDIVTKKKYLQNKKIFSNDQIKKMKTFLDK